MTELIKKYEEKSKTLWEVATNPLTDEIEVKKALACRRFVVQFIYDLKQF